MNKDWILNNPVAKECCRKAENLQVHQEDRHFMLRCQVCGCRHRELDAQAGKFMKLPERRA